MAVQLTTLPVGPLEANCYILHDPAGPAVIIDPGGDAERILRECAGMQPQLIVLTHSHVDHVAAACVLQRELGAKVLVHGEDRTDVEKPHPYFVQLVGGMKPCAPDGELEDGQELEVGAIKLRVAHTPGHSPGSVCLLWEGAAFTGDTLFAGSVGRTDLPGGSWPTLIESLRKLVELTTPETVIYPGHGPSTTMQDELDSNPFLADL